MKAKRKPRDNPVASKAISGWNRCDICGKYISISDFDSGLAEHILVTPDSEYTSEEYETSCRIHYG